MFDWLKDIEPQYLSYGYTSFNDEDSSDTVFSRLQYLATITSS